jgi:alpha-N-arabinofuranosidase
MVLTEGERMLVTPSYHVFAMYKVHKNARLVPLDVRTDDYTFGAQAIPAVHASASERNGKTHLSLVNLDPKSPVVTSISALPGNIRGEVLTAGTMTAINTFDEPAQVAPVSFSAFERDGALLRVELPPKAVVVLEATAREA